MLHRFTNRFDIIAKVPVSQHASLLDLGRPETKFVDCQMLVFRRGVNGPNKFITNMENLQRVGEKFNGHMQLMNQKLSKKLRTDKCSVLALLHAAIDRCKGMQILCNK